MSNQNSVDDDAGNSEHLEEFVYFPDALEQWEQRFDERLIEDIELCASIEYQGGDVDAATAGLEPDLWQLMDEALVSQVQVNNGASNHEESDGVGSKKHSEECLHLRDAPEHMEQTFDDLLDGLIREDLELHAVVDGSVDPLLAEDPMTTAGKFEPDTLQLVKKAITNRAQVVTDAGKGDGSGGDGSSKRVHLREALEDTGQSFDGFLIEDFALSASAVQQGGKVKFLPEDDDAESTRRLELGPAQPTAEAPTNPFQAVIDIAPNPNTPMETKVHTQRMKKKRPFGIKYKTGVARAQR